MKYTLPVNYEDLSQSERRVVRLQYIVEQSGICAHCGLPLSKEPPKTKEINLKLFPDTMLEYPVHLHHNHNTGMTIGAVHAYCNAVLWQYHGK